MENESEDHDQRLSNFSLLFSDYRLEQKFRQNQKSTDLFYVRYLALVIFAIELIYCIKDLNWSPHLPLQVVYFRTFLLTPLMLFIGVVTFYKPFKKSPSYISMASAAMIVGLVFGQYYMTALNPDPESSFAKTLPLLLLATYLFTGIRFRQIAILTPIIAVSFGIVMVYFRDIDNATKINDSLLVVMNIGLAVFFKYMQELSQRKMFLRSLALEYSEAELQRRLMSEQQLSSLRKNLLGILAHDIRSPLSNVRSILKLSVEKTISDEDRSDFFATMDKRIGVIDEGLNDLLTWVRSQEEGLEAELTEINVLNTVQNVISFLEDGIEKKGLEIKLEMTHDLALTTDLDILKTVLRNLLSNAIKFSYHNGEIRICATSEKQGVLFEVKDQGVGMGRDIIEKVVDQFHSSPGTDDEKGTGIGLNICHTLLKKVDSVLEIDSTIGEGTEASFFLNDVAIPSLRPH